MESGADFFFGGAAHEVDVGCQGGLEGEDLRLEGFVGGWGLVGGSQFWSDGRTEEGATSLQVGMFTVSDWMFSCGHLDGAITFMSSICFMHQSIQ